MKLGYRLGQIRFHLNRMTRQIWFMPAAFSLVAAGTVAIAYYSAGFTPDELPFTMPSDAVTSILTIVASSMLSVAVFALSTLVSALSSATQTTTPRAVSLIAEDRRAQTAISVFIGAFMFSVVGILGLSSGVYSEAGRLILFVVTIGVVVLVVMALITWIGQISGMGRVGGTIDRVEKAATSAFQAVADAPLFSCAPQPETLPEGVAVHAPRIGYVQHFNPTGLNALAKEKNVLVHVTARPGAYVDPGRPVAIIVGPVDEALAGEVASCFVVGDNRTFEHDPRFGLIVLNEIASRALSPGINDPGTAIDVLGTLVRVVGTLDDESLTLEDAPEYERVTVPRLDMRDIMEDAFRPIARDGAGQVEVVLRLLHSLATLCVLAPKRYGDVARRMAEEALARALSGLDYEGDREAVKAAFESRFGR
ncbi:DUF2254 domain-containing protein [Arsenicitalea aurantiaca]|uniref:DUF2254 domain-containing protein n=1 Tax=Arsenicitalea aurantiaca TaxID=1783274 RepID=A0A433XAE8_9HYPH|nr:DUF2254 domain-containing protein [Arsenicitalea aurantiaca]RUT31010.1 DUF2254 domain-containing protein [Arsenicitalea aurantiaca]